MDTGEVKVAVGLDVQIVAGIIDYLFETGAIPAELEVPGGSGSITAPVIDVDDPEGAARLVMVVSGSLGLAGQDPQDFQARIEIDPYVRPLEDAAPVAALRIGALIETDFPLLEIAFPLFAETFDSRLEAMAIPLFDPLIEQIEAPLFGAAPPARSEWAAGFRLAPGGTMEHADVTYPADEPDKPRIGEVTDLHTVPALVATLALPGESAALPDESSIVPRGSGIQMLLARDTMDAILSVQSAATAGTIVTTDDGDSVTIDTLTMRMHDLGIEISGRASAGSASITWDGILLVNFIKVTRSPNSENLEWRDGQVSLTTAGIDVDLPWWLPFLRGALIILGPIGWLIDALVVAPRVAPAKAADDTIRSAFGTQIAAALQAAIANAAEIEAGAAPIMVFGDDASVQAGHFMTSLIAFAGRNPQTLSGITYDGFALKGAEGRSVGLFELDSGHVLHPEELGRLLKSGIVTVPGLHGVSAPYGYYVRSDPTASPGDNLVDPALIVEIDE